VSSSCLSAHVLGVGGRVAPVVARGFVAIARALARVFAVGWVVGASSRTDDLMGQATIATASNLWFGVIGARKLPEHAA
jgi:hypothetical protein